MDQQSGNFTDETTQTSEATEAMSERMAHQDEELRKRRSTRIMQAVPLSVTGIDALGRPFTERTSTLIINCHGCRYQSKHYVLKNMWVTLEVPHPEGGQSPRSVRGRVAWIQRPRTVRQLFQVALELEVPGNTWGIAFPPQDWFAPPAASSLPQIHIGAGEPAPEASKTAEIHLPLTEPEVPAPQAQDNVRVFPAPLSATDASLQLARHMSRLAADAKQQLQAAAREIAAQAVSAERRISAEEWEQKMAGSREQLQQQIASALQKIQEESEARWRAAHSAAAEALQRELPGFITPQLELLTRELTKQIADSGSAARDEHTQHLASALETLRSVCERADESAARMRAQLEEAQVQLANRVNESNRALEEAQAQLANRMAESAHTLEETAHQREVTASTNKEALEAAASDLRQQIKSSFAESQSAWQGLLDTELSAAETRLRSSVETALAGVHQQASNVLSEHASKLVSQLQEESARHTGASQEGIIKAIAEAEQRIASLRTSVQEEAERQVAAARESLANAIAVAEQHITSLRASVQDEALRHTAAARESVTAALAGADQHAAELRTSLQESVAGQVAAARDSIANATTEAERRITDLRHSLREQSQQLGSALARATESTERLEHFTARFDTTQRQALASFESQIDDVLSLHRNELHRRSETLLDEINARIHSTFEDTCRLAISRFDQQVDAMVQPHVSKAEEAIHRLAGGRSLLDAALTLQQDRIRASADEAFAESLAHFRENLGGVEQLLQDAESSVTARNLADYESKIADLKHKSVDDLMKSAEWYEKKAQTQIQNFTEKTVEHAEHQFRDKAGEISSVLAGELDHSSRSFITHAQTQMDEVVSDAFAHSRALFAEAAETTTAAFTDEIQRQARTEIDGFNEEVQRTLGETRGQLEAAHTELAQRVTAEQETFLREFRARMTGSVEAEISGAQQKAQLSLEPLLESWKSTVDAHRHQMQSAYQELSNFAAEQHRTRLENVSNQWMLATVASLNQQSREAVASIAAIAEDKLRETCAQVFANVGESLRERLQQIAAGFAARQPSPSPEPPDQPPPMSRGQSAGGSGGS